MAESFKLSSDHTQKATLGCGTLILIALIVAIFSNRNSDHVERGLNGLRDDVQALRRSIERNPTRSASFMTPSRSTSRRRNPRKQHPRSPRNVTSHKRKRRRNRQFQEITGRNPRDGPDSA